MFRVIGQGGSAILASGQADRAGSGVAAARLIPSPGNGVTQRAGFQPALQLPDLRQTSGNTSALSAARWHGNVQDGIATGESMRQNMRKTISFIVPAFNMSEYLDRCVGSLIAAQSVDDIEVIIVDDG